MRKTRASGRLVCWLMPALMIVLPRLGRAENDSATPTQMPLSRYEHIWKSAPFVVATEVAPPTQPQAQRYALSGFAQIGSNDVVFLLDRRSLTRFSLAKGMSQNGVELVAVISTGDIKQLRARIRTEGKEEELVYDAGASTVAANGGMVPPVLAGNSQATAGPQGLTIPVYTQGSGPPRPTIIRRRPLIARPSP